MVPLTRKHKYLQPAIRGKIAGLLDYPVASARVILSGTKLKEKMCSVTGAEGLFMFNRIPPGNYTLEVFYSGFRKLVQPGIAVRDHSITGLDLKMDFYEDSRTIKLRAMSLEFVKDPRPEADLSSSLLAAHVDEVMTELTLDRVFFDPPAIFKIGRPLKFEIGVHQNLKGEIMRRLLERRVCRFDRGQIDLRLEADLRIAGCRVLLTEAPRPEIDSAGFLDWKWEIWPEAAGPESIHLRLEIQVNFIGFGSRRKDLLILDRAVLIKENSCLDWRRFFTSKAKKNERIGG